MNDTSEAGQLAGEVWRKLFDYFVGTRWRRDAVLERLGLTPNDAKALHSLAGEPGKPMGALAREWGTDPSAATWVVDRLEKLGLAARRADPGDRRVKLVALTARGDAVKMEMRHAFYEAPPEIRELGRDDLDALNRVLDRIAVSGRNPGGDEGT